MSGAGVTYKTGTERTAKKVVASEDAGDVFRVRVAQVVHDAIE